MTTPNSSENRGSPLAENDTARTNHVSNPTAESDGQSDNQFSNTAAGELNSRPDSANSTYHKLVNVAGVDGCVEAGNMCSRVAWMFGASMGSCESLGYTVPTGSQWIPGCWTVKGFKKPG